MIEYAILTISCDKYSSLWKGFYNRLKVNKLFENIDKYLITNYKDLGFDEVNTIKIGEDIDWSSNLICSLNNINEKYVFVTLEDTYFNAMDIELLDECLASIEDNNLKYLNTKANPFPKGKKISKSINGIERGAHYRASLCNAFWEVNTLRNLLQKGETPWEFEVKGSERSNNIDGFAGTTRKLIEFDHLVIGGKIARDVILSEDFEEVTKHFKVMNRVEWFKFKITLLRAAIFKLTIPQRWQQRIRRKIG